MKNNILLFLGVTLVAGLAIGKYLYQPSIRNFQNNNKSAQITKNNCLADDCLTLNNLTYPVSELADGAKMALKRAIEDEYKALNAYESVIKKFGQVRPFSMIKGAEEQHIASLKNLFDKYGLVAPVNNLTAKVIAPTTLQQACQIGVDAEIANAELYRKELLPEVTNYEDITMVFNNLMNASKEKHLPAFDRCN